MIPLRVYLWAVAVLALVIGLWAWGDAREEEGRQYERKAHADAATRQALRQSEANLGVSDAYLARERKARADAAAARTAVDAAVADAAGLRDALDQLGADPAADLDAARARIASYERILSEGASVVESGRRVVAECSERVGSLDAKTAGLQAYVERVCLMPQAAQ